MERVMSAVIKVFRRRFRIPSWLGIIRTALITGGRVKVIAAVGK